MTEHPVGVVTHFFSRIRVATVRVQEPISLGDRLRVKGRGREFVARVKSMQVNHQPIERAAPGQEVGIALPRRAREGDVVMRVEGEEKSWLPRWLSWLWGG
jgi:GTPase